MRDTGQWRSRKETVLSAGHTGQWRSRKETVLSAGCTGQWRSRKETVLRVRDTLGSGGVERRQC